MTHEHVPSIFFVTFEDIDRGVPASFTFCPLALSMRRAGFKRIVVASNFISAWYGELNLFALPDENLVDKIYNFDSRGKLNPFTAKLDFQVQQFLT